MNQVNFMLQLFFLIKKNVSSYGILKSVNTKHQNKVFRTKYVPPHTTEHTTVRSANVCEENKKRTKA